MTEERLAKLIALSENIGKLKERTTILNKEKFTVIGINYKVDYGSSPIHIDPGDNKLRETIGEIVKIYYEKRLAILKKKFEIL